MKKLLLSTAAVGLALAATPANAQVSLDVGGHLKGYVAFHDQDTLTGVETNDFDILRETEIHFTGETTLDNGLTVGVHVEAEVDGGDTNDSFEVDESYAYFSGSWGRVNFGNEDGAAYLLQVAAPSADDNVDGLRQYVQGVNYADDVVEAGGFLDTTFANGVDYDNDFAERSEKITYLSPIMNGFQVGGSYTPDIDNGNDVTRGLAGVGLDDVDDRYGEVWELAARYEGMFNDVGVILGAGYTSGQLEGDSGAALDDFDEWNVGADLDFGPIGAGVVYTENNNGQDTLDSNETVVLGVDYTTGPFKLGASWFNNETDENGAASEIETDRYSAGVVYSYGPGMTFRGSVHQIEHDVEGGNDVEATTFLVGTQITF